MDSETRRAQGRWTLEDAPGAGFGEGEILVDDDGVSAGPVRAAFLDADSFADADRVLTLGLFPKGTLRLSMLARRHETFSTALAEARDRARVAGLLAHGITAPETFTGAAGTGAATKPARILLFDTHVTAVPDGGDSFQVPFGAIRSTAFDESAYAVTLDAGGEPVAFSRLGRRTGELGRKLEERRAAQGRRLAQAAGRNGFADGLGVPASALGGDFDRLLDAWTAPERAEGAGQLLAMTRKDDARIGLVELLDPDGDALAAKAPLEGNLAAFLLVPVRGRAVLELLSGPSAATYVFEGDVDAIGRDLQALHFRRRPLALTEKETTGAAGFSCRLALRKLEPLKRLRAATRARVIHAQGWAESLKKAL